MKKILPLLAALLFAANAVFAQTAEPLLQLDAALKSLAGDVHKKIAAESAAKISVGQFAYRGNLCALGSYWTNQLEEELTNIPNRSFVVLQSGAAGAEWIISGEFVDAGNTVRAYTRLLRSGDKSVAASFHSDFERNQYMAEMLADGDGQSSGIARDAYEPDNWDNPTAAEIGDETATAQERSLHNDADEDFFLLLPGSDNRITMETTGRTDTEMELYDADTRERLAENDDGGSNNNARIRFNARAGKRYIAKTRGYGGATGRYGFRAYAAAPAVLDEYENDDDSSLAKLMSIGAPQQRSFHDEDDTDWIKFQIPAPGRYTIRAKGIASTNLDTVIELFDADLNAIAEDDDGGEGYDSRLSLRLERGLYYLKVSCLDDEPEEPYTASVEAE